MNLGTAIKNRMNEKKMNVKTLAQMTGIAPTTLYSFFKRGGDSIGITSLLKIAKALDISADQLIRSTDELNENDMNLSIEKNNPTDFSKRLIDYVMKMAERLSDESLEKLSQRVDELYALDKINNNLKEKK